MTDITIVSTPSVEDAPLGFEPSQTITMTGVEDTTSLAYFFSVVARALGHTWVESAILMDNKDRTWDSEEYRGAYLGD